MIILGTWVQDTFLHNADPTILIVGGFVPLSIDIFCIIGAAKAGEHQAPMANIDIIEAIAHGFICLFFIILFFVLPHPPPAGKKIVKGLNS
jgi:hypothetical protein